MVRASLADHRLTRTDPQTLRRRENRSSLELPRFWATHPLQWGRGLSTAETSTSGSHADRYYLLQWGRGLSTAETTRGSGVGNPAGTCFNGAAVFQPRRRPGGN